jgi:hypothetical protein
MLSRKVIDAAIDCAIDYCMNPLIATVALLSLSGCALSLDPIPGYVPNPDPFAEAKANQARYEALNADNAVRASALQSEEAARRAKRDALPTRQQLATPGYQTGRVQIARDGTVYREWRRPDGSTYWAPN